ncbi:MAG: hypothetical protein F9K25_16565 [Candidatus Contendobacter sp.]|nr:MAG: hypothetical protein F9K25_16565 [Candidatus Contendobacter sp.]
MEPIERLRQALRVINETAFQGLHFDHRPIQQEVKKLKETLLDKPDPRPPIDQMQTAIASFLTTSNLDNFRDIRLVSYGAATPLGTYQIRLIEKNDHFPKLLDVIDGYRDQTRIYRRLYRGLLASYFNYDPEAMYTKDAGPKNWNHLRGYLSDHIAHIQAEGITPDWVDALQEHRNLLTDDPCNRYAQAFLDGASDAFEDAERRLGFSGTSWVARAVVAARIDAAIRLPDREFKRHLSELLQLLGSSRHATLLNASLAKLLERYAKTQPLVIHQELRNFAVEQWKNPWLPINQNRWALVSESTRKMIGSWLKLDLMKSFFELLSADGSNDTRRLEFWIRYVDEITDMYFALGRYATQNQDSSFVAIRNKMAGRLLRLSGTGRENNAFVMTMGHWVFVEFGMQGHAAYIYPLHELPFALDGVHDINLKALKDTEAGNRLYHKDNVHGYARWEQRFDFHLKEFDIKTSADEFHTLAGVSALAGVRAKLAELTFDIKTSADEFHACNVFCRAFKLRTEDARRSGGYFWILTDDENPVICKQLRRWGFLYRTGKGWYSTQLNSDEI